jgi:hypothetical protein
VPPSGSPGSRGDDAASKLTGTGPRPHALRVVRPEHAAFALVCTLLSCGPTGQNATPPAITPKIDPVAPTPHVEWIGLGPRDGVDVDARYPHFVLADKEAAAAIDRAMDAVVKAKIDEFVGEAKKASREGPMGLAPWKLEMRCKPTLFTAELVSVRCLHSDYRGGAHPADYATATNHRLGSGSATAFSFDRMFRAGQDHRKAISDLCVAALLHQKAQWVIDGMNDVTKFLHTVNVTSTGLFLTFDPYETGPYAEGMHEVSIPWERIRPLVDPDGPIGALVR